METTDMSEYVIVVDPARFLRCAGLARAAVVLESEGMRADREGKAAAAIESYRGAVRALLDAAIACPDGHKDKAVLETHAGEVSMRAAYLEDLRGAEAAIPLEEHIHGAQLSLGAAEAAMTTSACDDAGLGGALQNSQTTSWSLGKDTKVMGAAAALSGATGLLLLGPAAGAALGAAAAYATTRGDPTGSAARKVGNVGVKLVVQAKRLNREHKISQRVAVASHNAAGSAASQLSRMLGRLHQQHVAGMKEALGSGRHASRLAGLAARAASW
eukprot:TRINITY_DN55423_c0_g1_i1.p1 TRINITY_DN55423_c0_g1~~TRINITY_DN55423_c0_g1_i1.p1  ORF type:complete len:289 (+),score=70.28 TRINITY_DN55423_c0_g1_i1:53-868(+)